MKNPPNFEIVVGTYEEYLLGYKLTVTNKKIEFSQSFATHAHSSSVRTVASSGRYLASGGADDRVIIYDMVTRKEHSMLSHHESTINIVDFTVSNTHVVIGSTDGVISIVRVGNWQVEKLWTKPHKGMSILDIAVHHTGKLALTLGADCSLRTWNLIKGRQAYVINLNTKSTDAKSLDFVRWAPCGEKFLLGGGLNVELWDISTGGILKKFNYKAKVTALCWLNEVRLAIGFEDGHISILNVETTECNTFKGHHMRVKCLKTTGTWLVSASSDGHIKIWQIDDLDITELGDCSTGCRCTALTLVLPVTFKKEIFQMKETEQSVQNTSSEDDTEEEEEQQINTISVRKTFKNDKGCRVIVEQDSPPKHKRKSSKKKHNQNKVSKKPKWTIDNA